MSAFICLSYSSHISLSCAFTSNNSSNGSLYSRGVLSPLVRGYIIGSYLNLYFLCDGLPKTSSVHALTFPISCLFCLRQLDLSISFMPLLLISFIAFTVFSKESLIPVMDSYVAFVIPLSVISITAGGDFSRWFNILSVSEYPVVKIV